MKAFEGFKSEASGKAYQQLPPGAYVACIKNVKLEGQEPDQTLILRVDIAEGEFQGYYAKRYKHDSENEKSTYPAKYKGDFRLRVPNPDNKKAMYPESDKTKFNDAIYRIEESNPGYHWDWNEKGLIGLMVGINVRQGTYNGSEFTKIGRLEIVGDVRQGIVKTMLPMTPRSDAYEAPRDQQSGFMKVDTDDVPF